MSYYNPLVEMLDKNKMKLAEQASVQLIVRGFLPDEPTAIEGFKKDACAILEVLIEAIRTGDPSAWRATAARLEHEISVESNFTDNFEGHSSIFNQAIKNLIEEGFAGEPKLKAAYLRRADSLTMVGNVSAITATIAKKHTS